MDIVGLVLKPNRLLDMKLIRVGDFVDVSKKEKGIVVEPDLQKIVEVRWDSSAPQLVLKNGKTVQGDEFDVYPATGIKSVADDISRANDYARKHLYKYFS